MTSVYTTALRETLGLAWQVSPVFLTNGIATSIAGGVIPIVLYTQGLSVVSGLLSGNLPSSDMSSAFAQWSVEPGGSLLKYQAGLYPFANQAVASNAMIKEPLMLTMRMTLPKSSGFFPTRLTIMSVLKSTLDNHIAAGGSFTVATPSYTYANMLLLDVRDMSGGNPEDAQTVWAFDFFKPLLTLEDAASTASSSMAKVDGGVQTTGTWSSLTSGVTSIFGGLL